jgi:hypothetical protein
MAEPLVRDYICVSPLSSLLDVTLKPEDGPNTRYLLKKHYSPLMELFLHHFSLTEHGGEASSSMQGEIDYGIVI